MLCDGSGGNGHVGTGSGGGLGSVSSNPWKEEGDRQTDRHKWCKNILYLYKKLCSDVMQ